MRPILILLAAFPAYGLDNCVRLTEAVSQAQSNRPVTLYRFFAKGEMAGFPRPVVNGSVPEVWQADVKNRWQDNSVQAAYISWRQSFTSGQTVTACFENSTDTSSDPSNTGLTQAQMVGFDIGSGAGMWGVALSTTLGGIEHQMNAKTMVNAGAFSYWLRGPVVTRVLVEDTTSPNPAYDTGYEYDFTSNTSDGWTASLGTWMNSPVAKWNMVTWRQAYVAGNNVTKGTTTTFRLTSHGLTSGQTVGLYCGLAWGVGNCSANWINVQSVYTVTVTGPDTFTIPLDSSSWAAPSSNEYFNLGPERFQIGVGSTNSYNPTNALAIQLNGAQYQLVVRDNGTPTTRNLTAYIQDQVGYGAAAAEYVNFIADGAAQKITVFFWRSGGEKGQEKITICASGCDMTVSSNFFSTSFVPLKVTTDPSGNVIPMTSAILYRSSRWREPTQERYKSLHPAFMLAFYPAGGGYANWPGVEAEAILQNPWSTRLQSFFLENLSVRTGAALSVSAFSRNYWLFGAAMGFSRLVWSGTEPARIDYDFNLDYLVHTGIIPPLDSRRLGPESELTTNSSSYDAKLGTDDRQNCLTNSYNCAQWYKAFGSTGGRGDIGLIPDFYALALFAMGSQSYSPANRRAVWDKVLLGNADAAFSMPIHYRESDTNYTAYNYPSDPSSTAFGRYISLHARPNLSEINGVDFTAACDTDPCGWRYPAVPYLLGIGKDDAHQPNFSQVPFLLTGRYSYLLNMWAWPAWDLWMPDRTCGVGARCYDLGAITGPYNIRAMAWSTRNIFAAAVLTPDGMAEKAYFRHMASVQDELWEGLVGVTGGNAANTCTVSNRIGTFSATVTGSSASSWTTVSTANIRPNGYNRRFNLIQGGLASGYKPTVYVNGVQVSPSLVCLKGSTGCSWYYEPGKTYVEQDASLAPLTTSDSLRVDSDYGSFPSGWCAGRSYANYYDHLGNPALESRLVAGLQYNTALVEPPAGGGHSSWFMGVFIGEVANWARSLGIQSSGDKTMFQYSGAKLANWYIGLATSPSASKYWVELYGGPAWTRDGRPYQNWSELADYVLPPITLTSAITGSTTSIPLTVDGGANYMVSNWIPHYLKIENEYIRICNWNGATASATVCTGGRGYLGSAAVAHAQGTPATFHLTTYTQNDYMGNALVAISMMQDLKTPTGTGRQAWENLVSALHDFNSPSFSFDTQPKLRVNAKDIIGNLRVAPGTGSVVLRYVAPDGRACKYTVGSIIPSSDDSGDMSDGGGSRERALTVSGLSGQQLYQYRVTCGTARLAGTARPF